MVLDKYVLSQGFGEQASNLIIGAERGDFDLAIMNMVTKMMIAYIDMLCVRFDYGEPYNF